MLLTCVPSSRSTRRTWRYSLDQRSHVRGRRRLWTDLTIRSAIPQAELWMRAGTASTAPAQHLAQPRQAPPSRTSKSRCETSETIPSVPCSRNASPTSRGVGFAEFPIITCYVVDNRGVSPCAHRRGDLPATVCSAVRVAAWRSWGVRGSSPAASEPPSTLARRSCPSRPRSVETRSHRAHGSLRVTRPPRAD